MLKQLTLAAITALALGAAVSSANAGRGGCDDWTCGANGKSLYGVALNGSSDQGVLLKGVMLKQGNHVANAVILPTGEVIDLR